MSISVTISGAAVTVLEQSVSVQDTADGRSVASFTVKDLTGLADYQYGQPVTIVDSVGNYTYTGYVNDTDKTNLTPNPGNLIVVNCIDGHYLPDKRLYSGPEYINRYAGDIITDLIATELAAEGITAAYASRNDNNLTSWAAGTLTSVVASSNVPGGDLELATAGSNVTITENTTSNFSAGTLTGVTAASNSLMATSTPAIKYIGTQSIPGNGNSYAYWIVWTGSQSVGSANFLDYDVWVDPSSPQIMAGIDLIFSDGSSLRDNAVNFDAQNIPPHPNNDLKGLADGKWYHRSFNISNFSGKTIVQCLVVFEGDNAGTYTAWFKNINYTDNSHSTITAFFASSLSTSQQGGVNGYSGLSVSVVTSYNLTGAKRISSSYSLDAAKILRSSFISWQGASPTGAQTAIRYTLDNWDGGYIACTNNAPLPDLPAGTSLAGRSITLSEEFSYASSGMTPELAPSFTSVNLTFNTSYTGTKSDAVFAASSSASWSQAGVVTGNVTTSASILTLTGAVRNFDDGGFSNQTVYGLGSPAQVVTNKIYNLYCNGGNDCRSRFDWAGNTWQDFTAEFDVLVQGSSIFCGLTYRTTVGWQNNPNTMAYVVDITTTTINLGRGSNVASGTGTGTVIATASITLTSGNWHHIKIVVSGTSHTVYLDNVQVISATDATYAAAGYVGFTLHNPTGSKQTAQFDNFGIIATNTMNGTWTSPSTSLTSLGNYSTSVISWRDQSTNPSNSTLTVQTSVNNQGTWETCTNGGAIPHLTVGQSLSGVTVYVKIIMSSTTAVTLPGIDSLVVLVVGSLTSIGNRIAPVLSLAPVGRAGATLVAWNGIQPTNTTIAVDTSLDGATWSQIGTGASGSGAIAGITTQTEPLIDLFNANTSLNYTSLYQTGGALATWTFDTANSRLEVSGGTNAILLYGSSTTGADCDISILTDASDGGGLCWRYQNQSNYYDVAVHDASSSSHANTLRLFKVVAGSRSQIGSDTTIAFTRGTPHIVRVVVISNNITVYFDGSVTIGTIDSAYTGAGLAGLRNNGNTAQFYIFRQQFYGDDVTAKVVYSRVRLSSSDPTMTPQITQLSVSCRNANIQNGVYIPQSSYSLLNGNKNTTAQIIDDLSKQSNFWNKVIVGQLYFQAHTATLAPWSVWKKDTLVANIDIANINDGYRNNQWITGGMDVISQPQSFVGDGTRTSFALAYPVDSISSITLVSGGANIGQTVGIKGTDTGKNWYYAQGNNTIVQDTSGTPLLNTQTLTVVYNGQITISVNVRSDSEIARIAGLDNTTGIVEEPEDAGGLNKAGMIQRASGLLSQFAVKSQQLKFTTMRAGLAVGQLISVFVSPLGLSDGTFLITDIQRYWKSTLVNGSVVVQPFYDITAVAGPVVGDWTRFISNLATLGA